MTLVLLLGFWSVPAQRRGYIPGYIITVQGDTLYGQVKDRSNEPFVDIYERIRFREEGRRGKRKLSADQIAGYGIGDRHYESVSLREDSEFFRFRYYLQPGAPKVFLQLVRRDGPLTYYRCEFEDDDDYLDAFPLIHREGSWEMVRVTQGIFGLKRKRLAEYFQDCPALVEAIESKALTHPMEVYEFYLEHCGMAR
ncbi:hypothetical protein [Robiginitalea myxolifaciens]|uniref:hypothetical protein n=1 Tax=Robiginitalea myxolifaciens TaxID=400055 RepID=UPI001FE2ABC8|nr:hypothetical protein [Robiginitalea myxolifaciens]